MLSLEEVKKTVDEIYHRFIIDSNDWLSYQDMCNTYSNDIVFCRVDKDINTNETIYQPKFISTYLPSTIYDKLSDYFNTYGYETNTFFGTNWGINHTLKVPYIPLVGRNNDDE